MPRLEQAVIDSFNSFFRREAQKSNLQVRSFSLGGQDTWAGADYVLSDQSQFALIEFKYTQNEIASEVMKDRRLKLCKELETDTMMRELHDQCHFIAWAEHPKMEGRCNVYRLEVCNQKVFGATCGLSAQRPSEVPRISARQFTTEFFANRPPRSLSLKDFETYLAWLLTVASSSRKSSLQLLTFDDSSDECAMVPLASIRDAYEWMQRQAPQPKQEPPRDGI